MTLKILFLAASALIAAPVLAQSNPTLDQRVGKVEKQLKAVQRKVFPNGEPIEPETGPAAATPDGAPVQSPVADLTARVDAIETSLAALTGQVVPPGTRMRLPLRRPSLAIPPSRFRRPPSKSHSRRRRAPARRKPRTAP